MTDTTTSEETFIEDDGLISFGTGLSRFDRDAVDAAIHAAYSTERVIGGPDGRQHAFVPREFQLVQIPDDRRLPPHVKASVTVDDRASITGLVNRFSDARTILLADYDAGTITARLDWHTSAEDDGAPPAAQPDQHRVTLKMRPSEEFTRWSEMQGKLHPQAEFAAFLEENAEDIVDPEPGRMIEISRDLEATQDVNFKAGNRLESGDRTFVYETETRVRGDVVIPREFKIEIPLYQGEDPVVLRCAFRFRIQPQGLSLGFEWRRVEYQRQAYFAQIAHRISEDTGRPVYLGRTAA